MKLLRTQPRAKSSSSSQKSTLVSQKSKHGFYSEFSVVPTDKNYISTKHSFRKGSKTLFERFMNALKPGPNQTYKDKYKENVQSCFSQNCLFGLFPILLWLPSYKLSWFKRDAMAGITVSILLVPQSLAYATLAGLPPEWGLYAAVMPILFYVLWGTSTQVAVGPVAPTAIMVASAVETVMVNLGISSSDQGYDELYQSIAMTLSFVCGIILIIFGLIRAGFIVVFLSRPVMTGFIMSAAFIILINQFRSLLGLDIGRYPLFYETLVAVLTNLHTINWYTALISAIALFILFLPKCCLKGKIPKWVPIPLIVIVLFILISYFADLESLGVAVVGADIQSGFPMPKPPNFNYIGDVFASAIVVAIVSYMGSIALAKGFEQKTKETYKQQLTHYNAWCRDNVGVLESINTKPPPSDANNNNNNNNNNNDNNMDDEDEFTPKRNPLYNGETQLTLKNEGKRQTSSNVEMIGTADSDKEQDEHNGNGSFSPTLSEKGASNQLLMAIETEDDDDNDDDNIPALQPTNNAARDTMDNIDVGLKLDTPSNDKAKSSYQRLPNASMQVADAKGLMKKLNEEKEDESDDKNECKAPPKPLSLPPIDLSPNMEFIAFGIANLLGSFFSSQVVSASFSRSALNFDMNGHSQISSILQAIICLLCLLFLMPLLSPLPKCVLASVVTVSVHRLIKNGINEFKFLWNVSRMELIEVSIAFIAPLVIGLEIGIFISIGTSIIVNLLRHSFTSIIFLGRLESTMSDDAEYVDCELFKEAKYIPHITIIEMKAELSFTNNNRLVDKLRRLLSGGNKYIVVSLNLTSFIDTTSIRQIVTIFEDAKGAYICLSQCRPKVVELIKRYEKDSAEFPPNVKTFISTHDAVRYLQSVRSKNIHCDTEYISDEDEDDLSSLSKPSSDHYYGVTPQIKPIHLRSSADSYTDQPSPQKRGSNDTMTREISDLDIEINTARKHTFSFRGTRSGNMSYSHHSNTHDQLIESDSNDEIEKEEKKIDEIDNNIINKQKISRIRWSEIKSSDHKESITKSSSDNDGGDEDDKPPIDMHIVDSLAKKNIAKIDENNEVEVVDGSKKPKE